MRRPSKNHNLFTSWPEHPRDVNDVIHGANGACEGRYGCMGGPRRYNLGSSEWVVTCIGLKSRAASARVTKHFVTFFSKTCNKNEFRILNSGLLG